MAARCRRNVGGFLAELVLRVPDACNVNDRSDGGGSDGSPEPTGCVLPSRTLPFDLSRTFTGWIAPACGWRSYSITSSASASSAGGTSSRNASDEVIEIRWQSAKLPGLLLALKQAALYRSWATTISAVGAVSATVPVTGNNACADTKFARHAPHLI
jgi:hypothetical protein